MKAVVSQKSPRVGVYARVSTSDQNAEMQVREIRQVASQRNWKIAGEYIDTISGATKDRPALERMMQDARAGKIDLVAVWKLDRLGRSLQHLLQLLEEFSGLGVDFVSIRDAGINSTTAQGKMWISIAGAFAQYEREILRERILCGIATAKQDGIHCGRPRKDFDLRPVLALLDKGHGLKSISKMLGQSRATLRRRLVEAGKWSKKTGVQKPTQQNNPEKGSTSYSGRGT